MPRQKGRQKADSPVGKCYRVTDPASRMKHGEVVLCTKHSHQRLYEFAPLWCDPLDGIHLLPARYWYLSEVLGTPTTWQPTLQAYHRLLGEMTLTGDDSETHPLVRELMPVTPGISMRTAHGGE
jgi:hypothetical protein